MGKLSEARERLALATAKHEAVTRSLNDANAEIRQLQSVVDTSVDADELTAAQTRLQALLTVAGRLAPQQRDLATQEKLAAEYLKSLELQCEGATAIVVDCARTIAILKEPTERILAFKDELRRIEQGLPPRYTSLLRDDMVRLGSLVIGDYQHAVKTKAEKEEFLRRCEDD